MKINMSAMLATIEFKYVNWRDEHHTYVVDVESIEFGEYGPEGKTGPDVKDRWVLHGYVVTRDDDVRSDLENRRRTFLIEKMEEVEEVQ